MMLELQVAELARFVEEFKGNYHFAQIVNQGGQVQADAPVFGQAQSMGNGQGQFGPPGR